MVLKSPAENLVAGGSVLTLEEAAQLLELNAATMAARSAGAGKLIHLGYELEPMPSNE